MHAGGPSPSYPRRVNERRVWRGLTSPPRKRSRRAYAAGVPVLFFLVEWSAPAEMFTRSGRPGRFSIVCMRAWYHRHLRAVNRRGVPSHVGGCKRGRRMHPRLGACGSETRLRGQSPTCDGTPAWPRWLTRLSADGSIQGKRSVPRDRPVSRPLSPVAPALIADRPSPYCRAPSRLLLRRLPFESAAPSSKRPLARLVNRAHDLNHLPPNASTLLKGDRASIRAATFPQRPATSHMTDRCPRHAL